MTTREYRTYRYGQLLALSDPRLTYWPEESTATAADPVAGQLSAEAGSSSVQWTATGIQTDTLYVRCQTGGYPGRGATIAVSPNAPGAWQGWDPPIVISDVERVAWSASLSDVGERAHARMIRLPDDGVLLVCEDTSTSGQTSIIVAKRSAVGVWGNELVLTTMDGDDAWPDVVVTTTAPVMVRVYALVHDAAAESTNAWMWEASVDSDLADSGSWTAIPRGVLAEDLAWADESDTVPTRLRAALGPGAGMLLVQLRTGRVVQFATRDDGYSWDTVGRAGDPGGTWGSIDAFDLRACNGAFVIAAYNTDTILRVALASNPFVALEDRVWREVHEPQAACSDVVLMAEDGSTCWLFMPNDGGSPGLGMVWMSPDGGVSWFGPRGGVSGAVGSSNSRGAIIAHQGLVGPSMIWLGDRALLVAETPTATGYAGGLLGAQLGGWTTLPIPARSLRVDDSSRRAWSRQWYAHKLPSLAGWTLSDTGAPSGNWSADGSYAVHTDPAERRVWSWTPAGVEYGTAIEEAAVEVDAGEARLYAEVTVTGGSRYVAWLSVTDTTISLVDGSGPTTLATQAATGVIVVRLVVEGQRVKAWWRQLRPTPGAWQAVGAGSGTLGAVGGAAAVVEISTEESSDVYWHWIASYHADAADPLPTVRNVPTATWSSPRDVIGRQCSAPMLTPSGASLWAAGGPMRPGDQWVSYADAHWSPRRMIATSPSDVLRGWRSTGLDDEIVAWKLGDDPESTVSPIWALHWRGDAQALHVAWHDGAAWGTEAAVVLYQLVTMERLGGTLVGVDAGANESGTWVEADELRGGMVVDGNDVCRRVLGNSEGMLHGSTTQTWQRAVLRIDADGTEETGSQTWRIVWPEAVVLLEAPAEAKGIRIRVGQTAGVAQAPRGYHSGMVGVLGPAHLLGLRHERDTVETAEPLLETMSTQAGPELRRLRQARRRTVEVSWQRTHDRIHQIGDAAAAAPDYITPWDEGLPGYSRGGLATTLRALVERAADGRPVLYVPSYDRQATLTQGVEVLVQGRCNGAILGQLDPSWRIEHAGYGDERRDATIRLGSLRLIELPRIQDDVSDELAETILVSDNADGPI